MDENGNDFFYLLNIPLPCEFRSHRAGSQLKTLEPRCNCRLQNDLWFHIWCNLCIQIHVEKDEAGRNSAALSWCQLMKYDNEGKGSYKHRKDRMPSDNSCDPIMYNYPTAKYCPVRSFSLFILHYLSLVSL